MKRIILIAVHLFTLRSSKKFSSHNDANGNYTSLPTKCDKTENGKREYISPKN